MRVPVTTLEKIIRLFILLFFSLSFFLVLRLNNINNNDDRDDSFLILKQNRNDETITTTRIPTKDTVTAVIMNVIDFGARGDGITDDTEALRRTIKKAASSSSSHVTGDGGNTVVLLPSGFTFLSGPLNLTSYVTLQVDGTLVALSLNSTTNWPQIMPLSSYGNSRDKCTSAEGKTNRTTCWYLQYQAFLYASHAQNVRIIGNGIIDGQGSKWWSRYEENNRSCSNFVAGRPNLIQIVNSQDVEISGLTLVDSPFWCVHPVLCTHVHIHHITIRSPMHAPNSDGIDPDSSRHVLIEHNDVSCGDDNISIKAGVCGYSSPNHCNDEPFLDGTYETYNVTVRNNTFRTGMGIAIGSEGSGGIRKVQIENNVVGLCDYGFYQENSCGWGIALHLKSTETRGGYFDDIVFQNNIIYNNTATIVLENTYQVDTNYTKDSTVEWKLQPTRINNIRFNNNQVRGMERQKVFLFCSENMPCHNISFTNNKFSDRLILLCKFIHDYKADANSKNHRLKKCLADSLMAKS